MHYLDKMSSCLCDVFFTSPFSKTVTTKYISFLFSLMAPKRRTTSEKKSLAHNVNRVVESVVEEATTLLAAEPPSKKWQNWWIRTITTLIMISFFFLILASGYIWAIIMVMVITVLVYREVIQIAYLSAKGNMRWFKSMSW